MKISFKPQSWLYPQPVLMIASEDADGTPNAMVAAWGGIYDTNQIGFMLAHAHKTTANIRAAKAFTVSMGTLPLMAETDYLGTVSGNDVKNKIAACGLHVIQSEHVPAPVIEEFPLTFECRVAKMTPVNEDFHIVGDIVNILADESILTDGQIDPKKLSPLTFDAVHRSYVALGDTCGKAWEEGKRFIDAEEGRS